MQDLMDKARQVFLEHFARLGLFTRVANLEDGVKALDEKVETKILFILNILLCDCN